MCLLAWPFAAAAAELMPQVADRLPSFENPAQVRLRPDASLLHSASFSYAENSTSRQPKEQPEPDGLVLRLDTAIAHGPAAQVEAPSPFAPAPITSGQDDNSGAKNNGPAQTLLLEIYVNGLVLPEIVRVAQLSDGRIVLPLDAWNATRLLPSPNGLVMLPDEQRGYSIQDMPGLHFVLNSSLQSLHITAPASAFEGNLLTLGAAPETPPKPAPPGVYLNYDASFTRAQGSTDAAGVVVEGVAFNGSDSLVSGAVLIHDGLSRKAIRTESYWRRDSPGRMEALVLGDAVGSGGAWSRPVRYGGIRFARDFSLAPGYITYPLPTMRGSAALPSTVDVFVNNQRRSSNLSVGSGPFDLTNVPVASGSGEVNLVVRDLRGIETVVTQKYYLSPRLLAPGLADFSLDAGRLRRNFGLSGSDYGPGFAAATYRYGLSSALTGEGRFEVQKERQAAGFELAGLLGNLATAQATAAWSRSDRDGRDSPRSGGRYLVGLERSAQRGGSGSLQWEHFDAGFRQFGDLGSEARPRDRMQAQTGMSLAQVALGLSYTRQTTWEGDNFRLLALNVGTPIGETIFLNFYANKRLGPEGGWSVGLNLLMPLAKQRNFIATSSRDSGGQRTTAVQASQSPPVGPGWGWRVRASDQVRQQAQAGAVLNSEVGQFQADANAGSGSNAVRMGASGSVGWLAGLPFATRRIDHGAFAVVRVADLQGVPVYRSNQVVAATNNKGLALVTGLRPYQKNQLTIDPDELPFNVVIEGVEEFVAPYARSGVFVDFPVRRMRNALVIILQPDGLPVPAGALVTVLPGTEPFVVGRRGEAYLTNLRDDNRLRVTWKDRACELSVALDAGADAEIQIGPLACAASK